MLKYLYCIKVFRIEKNFISIEGELNRGFISPLD